jgi:transposase
MVREDRGNVGRRNFAVGASYRNLAFRGGARFPLTRARRNDMSELWVGLDIGESETSICVVGKGNKTILECATASSPGGLASQLGLLPLDDIKAVVVESGTSLHLVRRLRHAGFPVTVLDAGRVSKFLSIRRNKTDTNDARGLAEIARLGHSGKYAVHVKSVECQHLRSQLVMRDQMVRQKTAAHSSLRSLLRANGSQLKRLPPEACVRQFVLEEVERLSTQEGLDISRQVVPLLDICEALRVYVRWADKELLHAATSNEVTKRFMQIPGVGPICAISFFTAIGEPSRFSSCGDVGAYLGLVPRVKQSGALLQRSRITKSGNKLTRSHLTMAAKVLVGRAAQGCAIRDWGLAVSERIGRSKATTAVARKLAVVMLSLWKSKRAFAPYPVPS